MSKFTHLHVHTQFSFLDGGSSLRRLIATAAEHGMDALAMTDHTNVSAAIDFSACAKSAGIKPIIGAEVTTKDGHHLTLLARNTRGYSNLCEILTAAHLTSPRTKPSVSIDDIANRQDDIFILSGCRKGELAQLIIKGHKHEAEEAAKKYLRLFGATFRIEIQNSFFPHCSTLNRHLNDLAVHTGLGVVATGNVHYAVKEDFTVHDILTCIRTHTTLNDIHPDRSLNAESYLFNADEANRRFSHHPEAVMATQEIADGCEESLIIGEPMFPEYNDVPPGQTSLSYLRELVFSGAIERYGTLSTDVTDRLEHELNIIGRLGFEDYFLFVWDVARYAKSMGVRYAGRGSAADSAVAYCLFITNVDSIMRGLLFERFLSLERAQRPDIDIDFDAHLRDDITQYIYTKYGSEHVATVCTFSRYHARSAIREIGKAMGMSIEEVGMVAKRFPHISASGIKSAIAKLPELTNGDMPVSKYINLFEACEGIDGFPRHVGTHLGGVVVSRRPLTSLTPLQMAAKGVVITQFDKDYIEDLGLLKLDLLCLRTLSAVEDSDRLIRNHVPEFKYDAIPLDDPKTYETLRSGQTIGVFQLESPAQRVLQSRLQADNIEDIVASVALIRPGPIEGNMVEPFIARRQGREAVTFLHPKLKPILEKTYGVVLFQEQVIEIATAIAGFTPGEADKLRKVMTHSRSRDDMNDIGKEFVLRALTNGIAEDVAATIFSYIVGYAGYGFCEAHAAAFADTAFKTAYLITHHPAEFFAAILNNQPMGYYPPHTICVEAQRKGIEVLGPDINISLDAYSIEDGSIRVPLKQVKGLSESKAKLLVQERLENGRYTSIEDFCQRTRADRDDVEALVLSGCFDSLHSNRRDCLWVANRVSRMTVDGGLLKDAGVVEDPNKRVVPDFSPYDKMLLENRYLGFSIGEHIMSFYRSKLAKLGVTNNRELEGHRVGRWVKVAGMLIRPHRPPTRSGKTVVFFALEDEFGLCDVTVFESVYKAYGAIIYSNPALIVEGRLDNRGKTNSVIASKINPLPFGEWETANQ